MAKLLYPPEATYLTVNEVAELFRVSTKPVRRWIADDRLHATRIGRGWPIARSDLSKLAEVRGNSVARYAM